MTDSKENEKNDGSSSVSCNTGGFMGCITTILMIMLLWALLFGITWDDKYYGFKCSTNKGVEFKNGVSTVQDGGSNE